MSERLNCNALGLKFFKDFICLERSEKVDVTLWIPRTDRSRKVRQCILERRNCINKALR